LHTFTDETGLLFLLMIKVSAYTCKVMIYTVRCILLL